jgi:hypothetical protein
MRYWLVEVPEEGDDHVYRMADVTDERVKAFTYYDDDCQTLWEEMEAKLS